MPLYIEQHIIRAFRETILFNFFIVTFYCGDPFIKGGNSSNPEAVRRRAETL
jgi:hypothetical protein